VSQTIGCSTQDFPSRRYINAHPQAYTESQDATDVPLKPIDHGGQTCTGVFNPNEGFDNPGDLECGYGVCNKFKRCECKSGYTGPTCKVGDLMMYTCVNFI
jgi:EGF-like domain